MKIYDTSYGPDTFGRIRMGLITEMFLTFDGFIRPEIGDHLRISCLFQGVVRDVYTVKITQVSDCVDEPETVLIQIQHINGSGCIGHAPASGTSELCNSQLSSTLH